VGLLFDILTDWHAGNVATDSASHPVRCPAEEQTVFADVLHGLYTHLCGPGVRFAIDA